MSSTPACSLSDREAFKIAAASTVKNLPFWGALAAVAWFVIPWLGFLGKIIGGLYIALLVVFAGQAAVTGDVPAAVESLTVAAGDGHPTTRSSVSGPLPTTTTTH